MYLPGLSLDLPQNGGQDLYENRIETAFQCLVVFEFIFT